MEASPPHHRLPLPLFKPSPPSALPRDLQIPAGEGAGHLTVSRLATGISRATPSSFHAHSALARLHKRPHENLEIIISMPSSCLRSSDEIEFWFMRPRGRTTGSSRTLSAI